MPHTDDDAIQAVFTALADPTRRDLIERLLDDGPQTATELANELPITRQGITKHLGILHEAGLVTIHQQGRDKRYALTPEPLAETVTWVMAIQAKWDERFEALRQFLIEEDD